jgi:signal transduction histidine kinase
VAIEDVTEPRALVQDLRAQTAQLAASDRHKSDFLAILAHELRNPLTPLRNALHIQAWPGPIRRCGEARGR